MGMKQILKNKGVAMVTVLITITFIGILASSLMYMAYMNYLTKAVRLKSTDNFYTDEAALDEIAVSLQQMAAAVPGGSIDAAVNKLKLETGITGTHYDPSKLEAFVVKTEAEGCDVTVTSKNAEAVVSKKSITYKNLVVTTVSAKDNYTSSITTDLTVNFLSKKSGDLAINDFSLITDDWVDVSTGSQVYEGNLYIENRNVTNRYFKQGISPKSNAYTNGRKKYSNTTDAGQYCAIWVHSTGESCGTATMTSPYAIFVGDVVIQDQASLSLAGNIAVFGNVYVGKNASLSVTGSLKIYGNLIADDMTNDVIGLNKIYEGAITDADWANLPVIRDDDDNVTATNGMTGLLYSNFYVHGPTGGTHDEWYGSNVDLYSWYPPTPYNSTGYSTYKEGTRSKNTTNITNIENHFGNSNGDVVHDYDVDNSLTILYRPEGYKTHGGYMQDCTIITKYHLVTEAGQNNDAFTGHMLKKHYDAAYYTTFIPGGNEHPRFSINIKDTTTLKKTIDGTEYSYKSLTIDSKDVTKDLTYENGWTINYDNRKFDSEEDWLEFVDECIKAGPSKYDVFQDKDSERFYVFDRTTNKNILPFGYLLAHDADTIVAGVFQCLQSSQDPSLSYVNYSNWIKD